MNLRRVLALVLPCSAMGCAGAEPVVATADTVAKPSGAAQQDSASEQGQQAEPVVTAEIGGLPPEAVARTFRRAQDRIFDCFAAGVQRVPFMGGAVRFWVKVDSQGKFLHAHLERSDLGDRVTEQCLLDVLMGYRWPTPVGGRVGVATFEMSFVHARDIQPPAPWPAERVSSVVQSVAAELQECKFGVQGEFVATVYVKRELLAPVEGAIEGATEAEADEPEPREVGKALAASATPPDEAGEMAVDCIVGVLKQATYPSPGETPAKVTFRL